MTVTDTWKSPFIDHLEMIFSASFTYFASESADIFTASEFTVMKIGQYPSPEKLDTHYQDVSVEWDYSSLIDTVA